MKRDKEETKVSRKVVEEKPKKEERITEIKSKKRLNENQEDGKHGFHYSFGMRLIIKVIVLVVLLIGFAVFAFMSFSITNKEVINFHENGDVDYTVYLKDNIFDVPSQGKGMAYVASLIDNINVVYNYTLDIDRDSNIDITYQVKAKLIIASQTNSNVFFEREYELTKEVIDEMVNKRQYIINKNVQIDYNYYNDLANQFKSNYAVNTNSYLEVYLEVNEKNKEDNSYEIENQRNLNLRIPLSQQEVNITFDGARINSTNPIVNNPKFIIKDRTFLALTILSAIAIAIIVSSLLKSLLMTKSKRSKYDKFVDRLLRGYDRVIVNVRTIPTKENYNIIKVDSFQELLDVRDNTKEPINYHVVIEHQKCEFFVVNQNNLYLYTIKSVDVEGTFEDEKEKLEEY